MLRCNKHFVRRIDGYIYLVRIYVTKIISNQLMTASNFFSGKILILNETHMLIYWIHVDVNNWSKHKRGTHLNTKPSLFGVFISIWVNMHHTVGIILDMGYLIWCCFFVSVLHREILLRYTDSIILIRIVFQDFG